MIGKVGTIMGDAAINIAAMQVGRTEAGGVALMGLNVDSSLAPVLLDRIVAEAGMEDAWYVEL
jgi:D-3-phosphoglycerate dehydrogenase